MDDGLDATAKDAQIAVLSASQNEVFAILGDSTSGVAFSQGTYKILVRGGEGVGWYELQSTTLNFPVLYVSNAHSKYRAWWTNDDALNWIDLPFKILNPNQDSSVTYNAAGVLKTSWFHADQVDVDKLAVKVKVETSDTSVTGTAETIKIEYAVDYDEGSSDANYKTLGNSTFTDGLIDTDTTGVTLTEFLLPRDTVDVTVDPVGKVFKAIRFKISEARGATTTNSPRLVSLTLEYRKKLEHKQGFRVQLDLRKEYKGRTRKTLRSDLLTILQSNTLVEFTFRDDSGGTRNYFVDTFLQQNLEETGYNEAGVAVVELLEA